MSGPRERRRKGDEFIASIAIAEWDSDFGWTIEQPWLFDYTVKQASLNMSE